MNTQDNTILIIGGSAGIGFELARLLSSNGNRVIITGRNAERLRQAAAQLPGVTAIAGDVSKADDVERLVAQLAQEYPALNLVINNAGAAFVHSLVLDNGTFARAEAEMLTNYLAIIRLNELLLPLLKRQPAAAIVNVSSIVAFAPTGSIATYSASKAALHSYTQSLRFALAATSVKVFELMPPLVNTDFSQDIGGANGIPPAQVAEELVQALEQDEYEIHVGNTAGIYQLSLADPAAAFQAMNG
ncbi:SDR family oxidoreductase [Hymenobacter terricola]|uniref:SDR family oxidoreductase n=1 Tax=Hymenobacter terricola TaxID=2819236 RepID=UPI001B307172|nr:SDR family NAD(P)-dependent oxidoreductase [Hymenobacter terricola]